MSNRDDELKYKDVIDTLKGLQKVNAPANFDPDLMRRINSESLGQKENIPESWWEKFFIPSRFIPSAALAISAVVLLFILNINDNDSEDPLSIEPKIRQDIIAADNISEVPSTRRDNVERERSEETRDSNIAEFKDEDTGTLTQEDRRTSADYLIDKSGLNFRQVNLSRDERVQLKELRDRFTKLLKNSRSN